MWKASKVELREQTADKKGKSKNKNFAWTELKSS